MYKRQIIAQNFAGLEVAFYASLEDASLERNPLSGNLRSASGTFFVRTEINNQCQGIEEFELLVNPAPVVALADEFLWCTDGAPLTIEVPMGFDSYRWVRMDGVSETEISNTRQVSIDAVGNYFLEITSNFGPNQNDLVCNNRFPFEVFPSNRASFGEIIIDDISDNNTVLVNVSGDGVYEYSLDGINYQDSNFFENVLPGFITIFVQDRNGCGISEREISIIGYPRFFTPNGDGINDFWQIAGADANFQAGSLIHIFNRFGKLLKQISPENQGWDGTFNGRALPAADYWFSVSLEDGRQFNGHFALKR